MGLHIGKTAKVIGLALGWLGVVLVFFAGALTLKLYLQPVSLKPYLHHIERYLNIDTSYLTIGDITFGFQGSFQVQAHQVSYNVGGKSRLSAENIRVRLSNHNLFLGRILPKHLAVEGLNTAAAVYNNSIDIAGLSIPRSTGTGKVDILHFLNHPHSVPVLSALKSAELNRSTITIYDGVKNVDWRVDFSRLRFDKSGRLGETLKGRLLVSQPASGLKNVPAKLWALHKTGEEEARFELSFKNTDTQLLKPYLPPSFEDVFSGSGEVTAGAMLVPGNTLQTPYFSVMFQNGTLFLKGVHSTPIHYNYLKASGKFASNSTTEAYLDSVEMLDDRGITSQLSGHIKNLGSNNLYIGASLKLSDGPFLDILRYIPDAMIPNTVSWLQNHMSNAYIKNFSVNLKGYPHKFPKCENDCGLEGGFDYENLNLKFLQTVPEGQKLSGTFLLRGDKIIITAPEESFIGNQRVNALTVTIKNLFHPSPKVKETIQIEGDMAGDVQELVTYLLHTFVAKPTEADTQLVAGIRGTHQSHVLLSFPLKNSLAAEDFSFQVASKAFQLSTNMSFLGLKGATFENAVVAVDEKNFHLSGNAVVGDTTKAQVWWQEETLQFGKKSHFETTLQTPAETFRPYVEEHIKSLSGHITGTVNLQKQKENQWHYAVSGNLDAASFAAPLLHWEKPQGVPVRLQAEGEASLSGAHLQFARLTASKLNLATPATTTPQENEPHQPVHVAGTFTYIKNKPQQSSFHFNRFQVGRTNTQIENRNGQTTLEAESIDITGLMSQTKTNSNTQSQLLSAINTNTGFFSNLNLRVNAEKVWMKDTFSTGVVGVLQRKNNLWYKLFLSGNVLNTHAFNVQLQPAKGGADIKDVLVSADNAGDFLRFLNIYPNLKNGTLQMKASLNSATSTTTGKGTITINNARVLKAPIIARILALLSLQELLDPQSGILFDTIHAPFSLKNSVVTLQKAAFRGPSIGLRFTGDVDIEKEQINIDGQMIPMEGINSFFGKIPVVGPILTGSQDGLLVADFSVTGSLNNPDISTNPLSVVTPGILKDFFSVITNDGSKKE